jgi:hypothetical protein
MIYSADHNFLLLKNMKVGGTSLEVDLSMVLPENAIVTSKVSDNPMWVLKEDYYYPGYNPRNYDGFYNHMTYSEISKKIDLSNVKSYVFIRNPFEVVLSDFFHRLHFIDLNTTWNKLDRKEKVLLVDKFFNNEIQKGWMKSTKKLFISDDKKIQVTKFLRYENGIENEINNVLDDHGINRIKLSAQEKRFRPNEINYKDVFLDRHLDIIYKEWQWEFNYFGYGVL